MYKNLDKYRPAEANKYFCSQMYLQSPHTRGIRVMDFPHGSVTILKIMLSSLSLLEVFLLKMEDMHMN